ncbi:MAG: hypothetical protein Q8K26_01050, partial [Candidatus Gracilibacteria bacterium]|nr:hypothetical protein [Candidatus Gracilibacteria bacterium]
FSSFNLNGFTLAGGYGATNASGQNFVAWNWKKGTTPGFDIVSYTGNGGVKTVNHSLGTVPSMMIVKNRNSGFATNWGVYHKDMHTSPQSYFMYMNSTNGRASSNDMWNNTLPTSSQFTVGNTTNLNELNKDIIAYLWSEVPGFSKFGSYTGNGVPNDGPFVYTGFRPRYVMIKRSDSAGDWIVKDTVRGTYNADDTNLYPGLSAIESIGGGYPIDITANGFKIRNSATYMNAASPATYIYAAFAEAPFKYANAR